MVPLFIDPVTTKMVSLQAFYQSLLIKLGVSRTVMTLCFRTDRSGQTVQTQIRLLLEEQSDQGLHCLLFHVHVFDKIPINLGSLFEF